MLFLKKQEKESISESKKPQTSLAYSKFLLDYTEFVDLLKNEKISKIEISPKLLNFYNVSEKGILTILVHLKGTKKTKLLPVTSINSFLENLEDFQRNEMKFSDSQFVEVEFRRPYSGKETICKPQSDL